MQIQHWERPDLLQSPEMARPGISTKNTEKIPPRPEILDSQNSPPKYPEKYRKNTPKIPKNAHFWYFFGIFGVFSWGSRISAQGVFFRYFSWKFRVGPSRGSVAGRGVLKYSIRWWINYSCHMDTDTDFNSVGIISVPAWSIAAATFVFFWKGKVLHVQYVWGLKRFFGPKRPTMLTFRRQMNQQTCLRLQSQSLKKKRAWDCSLKPILGHVLSPGPDRDAKNVWHLYFGIFTIKLGKMPKYRCQKCLASLPGPGERKWPKLASDCSPKPLFQKKVTGTAVSGTLIGSFAFKCNNSTQRSSSGSLKQPRKTSFSTPLLPERPRLLRKRLSTRQCLGVMKFVKIARESFCKGRPFAWLLANRDTPVAATLRRKFLDRALLVIMTKAYCKRQCSREL